MEIETWVKVPDCKHNEIVIDGKCVRFSEVESEIRRLLRNKKRTREENIRLETIHQAMKDYLLAMEEMKKQVQRSESYVNKLLSWWP